MLRGIGRLVNSDQRRRCDDDVYKGDVMISTAENFQHLFQDSPGAESHLLVAIPGQPVDRFDVTEVIRDGTSLVLQCEPLECEPLGRETAPEPLSRQDDDSDHSFYKNYDVEFLSPHDPLRFYEDLR
jgi:hypothetical protein